MINKAINISPDGLSRIVSDLNRAAQTYIEMSESFLQGAIVVAEVRDPARFDGAAQKLAAGDLVPHINVSRGVMTVSLNVNATGASVGTLFQYSAIPSTSKKKPRETLNKPSRF